MANVNVIVPDVGAADSVEVIELLVKIGDTVHVEQGLVTLESDKASMEAPSTVAGVVTSIAVKLGDKVKAGDVIAVVDSADTASASTATPAATAAPTVASSPAATTSATSSECTVTVPDVGSADHVSVIECLVNVGDTVTIDQGLVTLESDKASMDVPSTCAGVVMSLALKVGDKVKEGAVVAVIKTTGASAATNTSTAQAKPAPIVAQAPAAASQPNVATSVIDTNAYGSGTDIFASPSVRKIAREFGVNLRLIKPTGDKGRILVEDVQLFVKTALAAKPSVSGGLAIEPAPAIDFSKFGTITTQPLSKIKKLTGKFMHRNWVTIPHVTQFDEADITEMEAFRQAEKAAAEKEGVKLTPLIFIMKAVQKALHVYPQFNSSLDPTGEQLILKQYVHIGVAVDTPAGLVVPVVRDVDQKDLFQLARELGEISVKAREGKLTPKDMQGGCFTISSLGGIGGTAFTPIVNAPEVAILGVSRSSMKPVYENKTFVPRLMLPLSLSYDHRVIDGADGARFIVSIKEHLADIRRLLL